MSFYYIATTLVPVDLVSKAVNEMLTTYRGDDSDLKTKAKSLRATIEDLASKSDINLKLIKKPHEGERG